MSRVTNQQIINTIQNMNSKMLCNAPILVMLSGGQDSVSLLHLMHSSFPGQRIEALHVNYGLRGEDSDADTLTCRNLCDKLNVKLHVVYAQEISPVPGSGEGNTHEWARNIRYNAAKEIMPLGEGYIVTGHTTSDQAETVLYRLAASPSKRALLGIQTVSKDTHVVRPLLHAEMSREDTANYCAENQLEYRVDVSNDNNCYARARVRNGLLASMKEVDSRAEQNILRMVKEQREEETLLNDMAEKLLHKNRNSISITALKYEPKPVVRRALRMAAERTLSRPCPQAASRLDQISVLRNGQQLDIGSGATVFVKNNTVSFKEAIRLR